MRRSQTVALAEEAVLAAHDDDSLSNWPDAYRDPDGRWFGFSPRPRVIVYHGARLGPDELPVTWEDATDPRWKGRVVLADPRFGTTGGHLGAMLAGWSARGEPERFDALVDGLAANDARMLPGGNAAVVDAVLRGEADLGFTDADDVRAAQRRGLPVELLYPKHDIDGDGGGTFLMPNTVSIVEGAPNRVAAERLLAYLLSDDVARQLAESESGNIPLSPAVAADYPELIAPDPFAVDLGSAAAQRADAVDRMLRALRTTDAAP
jgi:iron(III) transport system substrate-binding protein